MILSDLPKKPLNLAGRSPKKFELAELGLKTIWLVKGAMKVVRSGVRETSQIRGSTEKECSASIYVVDYWSQWQRIVVVDVGSKSRRRKAE
ncbi:hypothetical protein Csa_010163 [Cucumis sativus]|uniref:Uncharacterized protein n=1 Tax=Cucumis sativus TaxID=3659 RepID=A0A0A0L7L3_CUCSA|nr:hypothetical protein Csa_010163 [Cucumis sativus]